MKKIVLGCAAVLLSLGLLAGCNKEDDDIGPGPEVGGTGDDGNGNPSVVGSGYLFGFEVDGKLLAIDGGTVEGYSYEGTVTEDHTKAADIAVEQVGSTNEYHISFELSSTQYWITIVTSGSHTNVSYSTSESSLYLHTNGETEFFGDEDGSHFLCYNSTFECLYCNGLTSTNDSGVAWMEIAPVAGVYDLEGNLLLGGKGGKIESTGDGDGTDEGGINEDPTYTGSETIAEVGADATSYELEVGTGTIVKNFKRSDESEYVIGATSTPSSRCQIEGVTFAFADVFSITFDGTGNSNGVRLWSEGIRVYTTNSFTVTALTDWTISSVAVEYVSGDKDTEYPVLTSGETTVTGVATSGNSSSYYTTVTFPAVATTDGDENSTTYSSVTGTVTRSDVETTTNGHLRIKTITVKCAKASTGGDEGSQG